MSFRKIVSLTIAFSFLVLLATGTLSYFTEYTRTVATIHTVFGLLFSLAILFHIRNNFLPLKRYSRGKMILIISLSTLLFLLGTYFQVQPFSSIMDYGATLKASSEKEINIWAYETIEMNMEGEIKLIVDLLRGEHYWHPQMAIWVEDMEGNYVETLFVSKATASGLFFGGRSKENFKSFDENKEVNSDYRRVNALPVWSHKRGYMYSDGMYVPPNNNPLPDVITGETITDNFKLLASTDNLSRFHLRIEINVAFDDNEFYSEFDFPDDDVFHNGTGQLGQPSIVFDAEINMSDGKTYYLMEPIGHGHQSGQKGDLYPDLSKLTTAKHIVERIVVGAYLPQ